MEVVNSFENESLILEDSLLEEISIIKKQYPQLPFTVEGKKFQTNDYVVGEIQLSSKLIRISPRHHVLNLSHFFEMNLYIERNTNSNPLSISFQLDETFGVNSLAKNLIRYTELLLKFGLTGKFEPKDYKGFQVKGKIKLDEYNKKLLPIEGIHSEYDIYEINNYANQIIKTALIKISQYSNIGHEFKNRLSICLDSFTSISEYKRHPERTKEDALKFSSSNNFYPIVLEYASKILFDLKLGYNKKGGIQWNSFLINSNDTFEKYIRRIISDNSRNRITKWETPKTFASIKYKDSIAKKSYSPDIIVDYYNDRAKAVFDVKNKNFSPSSELSSITEVGDIYQLLFYASQLKSEVCGLIYPSNSDIEPIELEVLNFDQKIFLISINFNIPHEKRISKFVSYIEKCLIYG